MHLKFPENVCILVGWPWQQSFQTRITVSSPPETSRSSFGWKSTLRIGHPLSSFWCALTMRHSGSSLKAIVLQLFQEVLANGMRLTRIHTVAYMHPRLTSRWSLVRKTHRGMEVFDGRTTHKRDRIVFRIEVPWSITAGEKDLLFVRKADVDTPSYSY